MAISQLYPNQRPTLNLNFARSKTLDPRFTFSRGNCEGTYVGSDGLIKTAAVDKPRFDHDPVTGDCRGLLIEELRKNFIEYSVDFQNQWTIGGSGTGGSATNNQALAPDGTSTAAKYAAPATRYLTISTSLSSLPNTGVKFNLATGAYHSTVVGTPTDYDIEPYGNGWYRCWFSVSNTTFSVFAKKGELDYISIQLLNSNGFLYAVNATSNQTTTSDGIYIWGAQIEEGAFPTSYIPTSGSTCTRNADLCIIRNNTWLDIWNTAGSKTIVCEGLNSIYSSEGAVNAQGPLMFNITYPYLGQLRNFYFFLNAAARNPVVRATAPAVENYHNNAKPGNTDPAFFKGAVTFQIADNRISSAFNGTLATSEAKQSSALFILNKLKDPASNLNDNALRIGGQDIAPNNWRWNGPISRFVIYNDEVSNETLEVLTS